MRRGEPLVNKQIYHIFNKSIAGFKIFNNSKEYSRMMNTIIYYRTNMSVSFSDFIKSRKDGEDILAKNIISISKNKQKYIQIIAYCIMPTHLHLILKQLLDNGISIFMGNVLNSYSRYFNLKYKRKGPLWEGKFQNVLVETDEQLLHLTRYIHLNPTTNYLVKKPEQWWASSYREYLNRINKDEKICNYENRIDIESASYKKFINDRISYQRELANIKRLLFE